MASFLLQCQQQCLQPLCTCIIANPHFWSWLQSRYSFHHYLPPARERGSFRSTLWALNPPHPMGIEDCPTPEWGGQQDLANVEVFCGTGGFDFNPPPPLPIPRNYREESWVRQFLAFFISFFKAPALVTLELWTGGIRLFIFSLFHSWLNYG